jgi:iron complex outermembrane recepter protein
MRNVVLFLLIYGSCSVLAAQDTTVVLPEMEVQAYRYNRSLREVPLSAGLLSTSDLERFDNTSFLPAVNSVPGVRMEERSPGSYRFSIRGSLIRSPFGVRNVKVYWRGLPLTDGGGNTYINLVDLSNLGRIEIIKGPGGSLYGAGTGGVVLLTPRHPTQSDVQISTMVGSYGLQRHLVRGNLSTSKTKGSFNYSHQQSDGYRDHTEFRRDVLNGDLSFNVTPKTAIGTTVFFTDVFYETPGGLTVSEFLANPRDARPAAGPNKGAIEQEASVRNRTGFAGVSLDHDWSDQFTTNAGVFVSYTDFENFAIRNYENRLESNVGGRLETQFAYGTNERGGKISIGAELQYFISPFKVYQNLSGEVGALTISDDLKSNQALFFQQAEFFLPANFSITVAASVNLLRYKLTRTFPEPDHKTKLFSPVLSPRLAVMKKLTDHLALFASAAKGFSPPTLAEVRPSTESYNENLKPEYGVNYEAGVRATIHGVSLDVTAYSFQLQKTIVLQRLDDGAEYFINAGETRQKGIEASVSWQHKALKIWTSYNYSHYRFENYIKDGNDFSGNKLTGVPPTVATFGLDVTSTKGPYANITAFYNDHIPLNDSNTAYSREFILLNLRAGYRMRSKSALRFDFFGGVSNILDERYSLGNDLNAFGGRYYNVAPGINLFAGLEMKNLFAKR